MKKYIVIFALIASCMMQVSAQSFVLKLYPTGTTRISSISTSSINNVNSSSRYQNGYTIKDGTFVTGHMKTISNGTNLDNYSTRSNVNLYTGTMGSRAHDYSPQSYNYGSGSTIHTGSRGGQYDSNGNKTYVPKRSCFPTFN